ncbi:MBL fold metallo-hydrolase [Geodermatophilus amargosae]|uniref:MBL fold metallo-hydrolase n=1 Tax=Geodermatophilus amargosae TaxID=1296565 RepID=UPI0034E00DA5
MRVGEVRVDAVADGTFVARRSHFGEAVPAGAHPEVFDRDAAWLPIGCFVVRTGDRVVLVDAGPGPEAQSLPDGMLLAGGQLPTGLRALGVRPDDVTDGVCTHLHPDHVGWLFGPDGEPVSPGATVWFGAADGAHSGDGPGEMAAHVRTGFRRWAGTPRLRPLTRGRRRRARGRGRADARAHARLPDRVGDLGRRAPAAARRRDHLPRPARRAGLAVPRGRRPGSGRPHPRAAVAGAGRGGDAGVGAHFPQLARGRVTGSRLWRSDD